MKTIRFLVAMLIMAVAGGGVVTMVHAAEKAAEKMGRATAPATMEKGERMDARKNGKKADAKAVKQPAQKATAKPPKKDKEGQRKAAAAKKATAAKGAEVGKTAVGRGKAA